MWPCLFTLAVVERAPTVSSEVLAGSVGPASFFFSDFFFAYLGIPGLAGACAG